MKKLHKKLLEWYRANARDLPWRRPCTPSSRDRDAYSIWLSEIMLQQTRVETVLPYHAKFLARFPKISDLASADIDELRALWAGLGYYSRVVNLQRAAQKVVADFGGVIPRALADLRTLPGVGPYTAAAVASIAYGENVAAIDGNLERVIARLLGLEKIAKGAPEVREFADRLVSFGEAGSVNQALMDLSSTTCSMKNPKCMLCPLAADCVARERGLVDKIPMKAAKKAKVDLDARALLAFHRTGKQGDMEILVARRPEGSWLSGMWDLPWTIVDRDAPPKLAALKVQGTEKVSRTITHHKVRFSVDYGVLPEKPKLDAVKKSLRAAGDDFRWIGLGDIDGLPNPSRKAIRGALKALDA